MDIDAVSALIAAIPGGLVTAGFWVAILKRQARDIEAMRAATDAHGLQLAELKGLESDVDELKGTVRALTIEFRADRGALRDDLQKLELSITRSLSRIEARLHIPPQE